MFIQSFFGGTMRVFLGGTANSEWRKSVMNKLGRNCISYYDPRFRDWEHIELSKERIERKKADILWYVITPSTLGFYPISAAIEDSILHPGKVVFCSLKEDQGQVFSIVEQKSLDRVGCLMRKRGCRVMTGLSDLDLPLEYVINRAKK